MVSMNRARTTTPAVGVRARFASVLAAALMLSACGQGAQEDSETSTAPALEVRHDTAPLAEMFPLLGEPESASWIMWDNSRVAEGSRVKVVWIDAVAQVSPQTMDRLVAEHPTEARGQKPAVQAALEPELPPGPFRSGVELNMAFGGEGKSTRVFLDDTHDAVVLQSYTMGAAPE
ncbi:hypothetical protein [Mycolicibacterium poriferae]|uniref:hypothetical protein n=1 Tax=Mycolicibacterium poriferae TaxID=39694 RepID=UPI0024BB7E66|nr:hypothetical protein [Mycolicibacterium poriferae]